MKGGSDSGMNNYIVTGQLLFLRLSFYLQKQLCWDLAVAFSILPTVCVS